MTWPRNPRIDRTKLYSDTKPATATYRDNAEIVGELTLADLRHLVHGTEDWPASAEVHVCDMTMYSRRRAITVTAQDTM